MHTTLRSLSVLGAILIGAGAPATSQAGSSYKLFESGQVRPLALSPNGKYLFATNTPDNRLEIYKVRAGGLQFVTSVAVGMEPVAVAARKNNEVWVVNHLSDSVSVVRFVANKATVERTLLVGDEPRDIVFAGPGRNRAFITCAHRGQNVPFDPQLSTPGIGRADVWVYNANKLDDHDLNGGPLTILNFFTDTPRALATSADGSKVYVAGLATGNKTTIVNDIILTVTGIPNVSPGQNVHGEPGPATTSILVKWNGEHWLDADGRVWDDFVRLELPDEDVFAIDATANPPAPITGPQGVWSGVGTILYNMAVNPVSGKIYVSNTEARNDARFEGPGIFTGTTVRAHHNENRITVLSPGQVAPRHLNKHVDYSTCCAPIPNPEQALSLGLPTGMAVSSDGSTLYVAAMGSSKLGIYNTAELEADTFVPNAADQVQLSGGGPTGVVIDEARGQLFVLTRFDNGISVVDASSRSEVFHTTMFSPEPANIVAGRRFLYDTTLSSKGDSACGTCHVFADKDEITWDLSNPDAATAINNNPTNPIDLRIPIATPFVDFNAMKGPMATQSLRGLANHGAQHWRGDRTGAYAEDSFQPNSGAYDEREAFRQFQVAFEGLVGRPEPLDPEDMELFIDFALELMYPPNPIRNLDDSLTPEQQAGRDFYFNNVSDSGNGTCVGCHVIDPNANAEYGEPHPGFFGTDGRQALEPPSQVFKIPHLRNLYTKVGMFGFPPDFAFPLVEEVPGQMGYLGPQIRGFGFAHDGSFDSVMRFLSLASFSQGFPFGPNPEGFPVGAAGESQRRAVESFLFAFPSNLKPVVGQQVTVTWRNLLSVLSRAQLLLQRAEAGDCEVVAKSHILGHERGFLYLGNGVFKSDKKSQGNVAWWQLLLYPQTTLTCAPPDSGYRMAIDRDEDGILDGDDPHLN